MTNTGQFPDFEPVPTPSERQMARDLLKLQGTRPGFLPHACQYVSWLLFRYLPVGPFIFIVYKYVEDKSPIALLLILAAWGFYHDVKSIRHSSSVWVPYDRFLDWDKVRKIAEAK